MASESPRAHMRPMDFGEILDSSVRTIKSGWKPLLLTGLICSIPWIVYQGMTLTLLPSNAVADANPMSNALFRAMMFKDTRGLWELAGVYVAIFISMALIFPWLKGALIVIASRVYLGLPVTMGMALRIAGRRYFALLGTGALVLLFAIIAVPALILGGLLFLAGLTVPIGLGVLWAYLVFSRHALLIEGVNGGYAPIRRSFRLVSGRFWPLLGMGLVFYLFVAVLNTQFSFITQLPAQLLFTFTKNPELARVLAWVTAVFTGLLTGCASILYAVGQTLVYYDTRMRKEGLDLEILAARQTAGDQAV